MTEYDFAELVKEAVAVHKSFLALLQLSEEQSNSMYREWHFFASLLDSENTYKRLLAVRILANLASVDTENKFENILDKYYGHLGDNPTVARYVARDSGKIINAKPNLEDEITSRLLNYGRKVPKDMELLKAYVIEAFDEYYERSKRKQDIMEFVKDQLNCTNPKTKIIAKRFVKRWE